MDVILQMHNQSYAHRVCLLAQNPNVFILPAGKFGESAEELGPKKSTHHGPNLVMLWKCTASKAEIISHIHTTFLRRYVARIYWCHGTAPTKEAVAAQVAEELCQMMNLTSEPANNPKSLEPSNPPTESLPTQSTDRQKEKTGVISTQNCKSEKDEKSEVGVVSEPGTRTAGGLSKTVRSEESTSDGAIGQTEPGSVSDDGSQQNGATESVSLRESGHLQSSKPGGGADGHLAGVNDHADSVNSRMGRVNGHLDNVNGHPDCEISPVRSADGLLGSVDGHVDSLNGHVSGVNGLVDGMNGLSVGVNGHVGGGVPKIRLRIQACPKTLEAFFTDSLPDVDVGMARFTHVLGIAEVHAPSFGNSATNRWVYHYGISPVEEVYFQRDLRGGVGLAGRGTGDLQCLHEGSVSKAVCKMEEVLEAVGCPLGKESTVIDLGAAPGAWTAYLARHVARVVAVDPAEMGADAMLDNVTHIRKAAIDARDDVATWQKDQLSDLLVCDINKHPKEVLKWAEPLYPFLRPGGLFIMTLKFFGKARDKSEALSILTPMLDAYFVDMDCVWLLANTVHERTLVARKR